jgi:hypothetical protein
VLTTERLVPSRGGQMGTARPSRLKQAVRGGFHKSGLSA